MKFDIDTMGRIYKILRPEPRKWVARVLITAGIPLLSSPVWAPYADALLKKYYDLTVPQTAASFTGWTFIAIGLCIIYINYQIDSKVEAKKEGSEEERSDRKTLLELFSQLHIPTMDLYLHYGKMSTIYLPVTHYSDGLSALVNSSNFYLHNEKIKNQCFL